MAVSLLFSHGDGSFGPDSHYFVAGGSRATVALDLNTDGRNELALASTGNGSVTLLFNTCVESPSS
jgi:hypothetical protein